MMPRPSMLGKTLGRLGGLQDMAGRGARAVGRGIQNDPAIGLGVGGGAGLALGLSVAPKEPELEQVLHYVRNSGGWNEKTRNTLYEMAMNGQIDKEVFTYLLQLLGEGNAAAV